MKSTPVTANAKTIFSDPIHFFAFGFGSGLSPIAPGTMGTLAVIPIYLLMQPLSLLYYGLLVIAISLIGIWICGESSKRLGVHDHKGIVWDEFAGYLITMFAVPFAWQWVIIGFLLFRLFDIWKPWPIYIIDKQLKGGLGIMLDDVLAGIFAAIILQILIRIS